MTSPHLLLVGCGKMGSAMLRGWYHAGYTNITVVDPHDLASDLSSLVKRHVRQLESLTTAQTPPVFDAVILAVKPQAMDDACRDLKPVLKPDVLVVSIAAGRTISGIQQRLSTDQPVVRAMPNTPAAIGRGITAAIADSHVTSAQRDLAQRLLSAMGHLVWVADEPQMDAVTAVSGSGPAYVFMLIEVMAAAGEKMGLPHDLAVQLARQTVIGSAALADAEAYVPASTLRQNVTSPGGTTAAAIGILNDTNALQRLFDKAIEAATLRARELSR